MNQHLKYNMEKYNRGTNTKSHWEDKHDSNMYEINREYKYDHLDNILDHCEYAIVTTVDTEDDCGGEHISHYKIDTFNEKGYDVIWKSKLTPIRMPDGIYNYIGFVINGKLN